MEEKYVLKGTRTRERLWKDNTEVWYFDLRVYYWNLTERRGRLEVLICSPCRSYLYKLLTGLFFNWNWKWETVGEKEITEEDLQILQYLEKAKKEYRIIRKAFEKLKEGKEDEVRKFLKEKARVHKLLEGLKGE